MKSTHRIIAGALAAIAAWAICGAAATEPAARQRAIDACKRDFAKSAKDRAADRKLSACLARIRFDGDLARYQKKRG